MRILLLNQFFYPDSAATNQPVFGADRGHIHPLKRGFKPGRVAYVFYGFGGIAA